MLGMYRQILSFKITWNAFYVVMSPTVYTLRSFCFMLVLIVSDFALLQLNFLL